jgi:phosphohistidine phosphatase SixA
VDAVDFARTLTARGEAQARYLAAELSATERRVRTVVASRFPRALATARAIAPAIHASVVTDARLEVDHPVSEALEIIQDHAEARALMLVAHNPQLGELISVLCHGLGAGDTLLRTGELVALDVRPTQPIGTARIVARLRLSEDAVAV